MICHNEIRELTASLLTEVCHEVSIKADLQPFSEEIFHRASTNIQDGARLDVAVSCFWGGGEGGKYERSFCDVKAFNPHAPSNRNSNLASCYRRDERLKNSYEQKIRDVEHASFTPLVFPVTGGLRNEAKTFYKRLASLLASKWDKLYSSTMAWLRCRFTSLLRSSIRCIPGARSHSGFPVRASPVDLVRVEASLMATS